MATENATYRTNSIGRSELMWLAGAVVFSLILRLGFLQRIAIEHFDEGVYASNFWFGGEPYPAQYLYAPPLLPTAIEWTLIAASLVGIKPTGFLPVIPSLVAGIGMVPSIWWVCRRWFGVTAALTSAWLVATSDFHACYSRAALTDVPVCLFILWAVYFIERAFAKITDSSRSGVEGAKQKVSAPWQMPLLPISLAGLFTALAWWTKYNGWLPLAIGLSGGIAWQYLLPRGERQVVRLAACFGLIALLAALLWVPVVWQLQKHGGYASVTANHRNYVVGPSGWRNSAWIQINNVGTYENPLQVFVAPFINWGPTASNLDHEGQQSSGARSVDATNSTAEQVQRLIVERLFPVTVPIVSMILTLQICLVTIVKERSSFALLPVCLCAAWFGGLTVATPMYYPYPRLVLPWLCVNWICLGLWWQTWCEKHLGGRQPACIAKSLRIVVGALLVISIVRTVFGAAFVWQDRSDLQRAAVRFASSIKTEASRLGSEADKSLTFVLGEPAIVFGIAAENLPNVVPVQNLDFVLHPAPVPTFLILSSRVEESLSAEDRARLTQRFESVASWPLSRLSHLVFNETRRSERTAGELLLFRFLR
jgi:dolichyl-phosphate-mannose-protein mannosyltransferase